MFLETGNACKVGGLSYGPILKASSKIWGDIEVFYVPIVNIIVPIVNTKGLATLEEIYIIPTSKIHNQFCGSQKNMN